MKTKFDWQTEVESQLEQPATALDVKRADRKIGCLIVALAVVSVFSAVFLWQFKQRQAALLAEVEEDVFRVFELQQQAAAVHDKELFSSLLSSGDRGWKRDQERLLDAGLYFDGGQRGAAGGQVSRRPASLELSPDLLGAELTYVEHHVLESGPAAGTGIDLQHALVYRLEDGRWLNAAPDSAYWGTSEDLTERLFSLTFPARDAELALPLARAVADHLETICSRAAGANDYGRAFCDGDLPWRVNLGTDAEALLYFGEPSGASSKQYDFELPTPTLFGLPADDEDRDRYIRIYAAPLLQQMEAALLSTAPIPEQPIYALCFKYPLRGRHLYRYDWRVRSWQPLLPKQAFNHLSALPDDSAILLADGKKFTIMRASDGSNPAVSQNYRRASLPENGPDNFIGWTTAANHPYTILKQAPAAGTEQRYSALDQRECPAGTCRLVSLPGFPAALATGESTIYATGSELALGRWLQASTESVGRGFSPFWLDDDTYGFVRFAENAGGGLTTQVVLADLDSGNEAVLLDGADLARAANALSGGGLFVNDVVPNSAVPGQLLLSATGIHAYSGQYFIFTVDAAADLPAITLQVVRSGSQGGVPGLLTPTGPLPFLLSHNGRWLAMTELRGSERDNWAVLVHDLQTGITREASTNVPAMPGNFPLLDWSADGQWLLVADRDFLLLYAPELERQETLAHGFDACTHIVWAG